ncbi:MAG TPA: carbohydrate kinase family protein [Candidatus Bathyarchaeia archaeon]|nr:carbohydrate kinase family protein [Candidatus Bathyarchaeia archaeon]
MIEVYDVISIGAVLIDMIAIVDEFPQRDGESFVHDFKMMPGGAAANVAVICSRLGLKTAFSGKIGKDRFGEILKDDLLNEGVSIKDTLITSEKVGTGSCYICVDKKGERMILAYSGAADTLTSEDLPVEFFSKAKWVNLSDLRNVSSVEALLESDIPINFSISPGALIAQNPSRAYRFAQQAKLLVASKKEFSEIFRCLDDEIDIVASNFVKENKERIVAVTKGKDGATLFGREGIVNIPIFPVNVVDTTGAGDAFTAGMLYAITREKSLKEAGRIAAGCSALCIQEVGARSGPKSKRDLVKFLRKN